MSPPAYFRLAERGADLAYVKPVVRCMIPLNLGRSVKGFPIPKNLKFELDRLTDNPVGNFYPDYYLMSSALADLLQRHGVDNLELFPTSLVDKRSGETQEVWTFNIVGLVAAANMAASTALPLGDAHVFQSLVVDPSKAKGLLLFRLANSMSDVIVHSSVAERIQAAALFGVLVEPLAEQVE